ncbi:protein MIZU-KUSSEI 1 [Brachypodium distachyon]|uniref:Protein MIZU-KUSSEI 1 n=1 Tax=Brachypodium distachyon TaxID=15368 RepID=I1GLR5_BRADI|nr:protein MIZU-KUSSEI 1 [Brachypodium distachyon]KQK12525.2 hypothetical protein BRADI_1g04261v3 [Brachypodium distachyon]|eukprot:XP_014758699.1 protein MIZU-KUSSEI 1 [Brachypodium distachyon]
MPRTTPSSPLSRATPPRSPTAASRLAVAPASPSTPQCAIPASPRTPVASTPPAPAPATPRTPRPEITLREPAQPQKRSAPAAVRRPSSRALRKIRSLLRSLPIIAPAACRPASALPRRHNNSNNKPQQQQARVTGTFYGHRRARVALAVQERPGSLPTLVLELGIPTGKLMHEISSGGHVRIALECEKKSEGGGGVVRLMEEAMWTAYVNGRRVGYAVRREATGGDLAVMQLLSTVSAGAGVLPGDVVDDEEPPPQGENNADAGAGGGEVAYMRAGFERVTGSKDSESLYMVSPDGDAGGAAGGGTELSIFFVRV